MKISSLARVLLIFVFFGLVGTMIWWIFTSYFPFNKPTPLSSGTLKKDVKSEQIGGSTATQSASTSPTLTPTVDPVVKKMFPFDSAQLDDGVKIGKITITTVDVLNIFSSLAYRTSRDLTDKALWQEAAIKASQQAIIIDEASKRGFNIPASDVFLPESLASATTFLTTQLKTENAGRSVDDIVAQRKAEFIVIK